MKTSLAPAALMLVALLATSAAPAFAQRGRDRGDENRDRGSDRGDRGGDQGSDRGGGGFSGRGGFPGGGFPGGGPPGGGPSFRGGFDPNQMFKDADKNNNGQLEPDEVQDAGRARFFISMLARRAGMDESRPISIDKLIEARDEMRRGWSSGGSSSSDRSRDDRSRSSREEPKEQRLVPGFGEPAEVAPVLGFGDPNDVSGGTAMSPEVQRYVNDVIRRYDKNGNGYLEAAEWKGGRWGSDPALSDVNRDGRLTREELAKRYDRRQRDRESGSSSSYRSSSSSSSDRSSSSSSSSDSSDRIRRYAESMMNRYDDNKNGILEEDEWKDMRGDPKAADRNGDGKITLDELSNRLASYGGGSSSGSRSSGGSSSSGSQPTRKIRALTAAERLPKGIPDWFTRNDLDGDGQLLMAEFAASWSSDKAKEFASYDTNGDGVITPEESTAEKSEKSSSSSSSGGSSRFGRSGSSGDSGRSGSRPPSSGGFGSGGFGFGRRGR